MRGKKCVTVWSVHVRDLSRTEKDAEAHDCVYVNLSKIEWGNTDILCTPFSQLHVLRTPSDSV